MDNLMYSYWEDDSLLNLIVPGVFGIFDDLNKEVFVSCSNNVLKGISSVVTKIREKDHHCSHFSKPVIRVLYLGMNHKLEGSKLIDRFKNDGFKILNKVLPIKLRAIIRTLPYQERMISVVTVRNSRGEEKIVAAFDKMEDCSNWYAIQYKNGCVSSLLYLESELLNEVRRIYETK